MLRDQVETRVSDIRLETKTSPIIIFGMHRSGTSMITAILRQMGLMTGWSWGNEESVFFHRLNLFIERMSHGRWDDPEPIARLKDDSKLYAHVLQHLSAELTGPKTVFYFGVQRFLRYRSLSRVDQPWGWKDPRNTYTLDLWRSIFPGAKLIHIYRNGVDVAASLRNRELQSRAHARSRYASPRCHTLEGAFGLWLVYLQKALSVVSNGEQNEIMQVCYEDFVMNPKPWLERLIAFCGLQRNADHIDQVVAEVNPLRAYPFRQQKELVEFYEQVRTHPCMVRLSYDRIESRLGIASKSFSSKAL